MNDDSDKVYLAGLRSRRTTVATQVEKLSAQLLALDKAISGLSALVDDEPKPSVVEEAAATPKQEQRAIWEEARDVLQGRGSNGMSSAELVEALKARGVSINSVTPENIVFSALSRRKEIFVKLRRGVWGLASLHPALAEQQKTEREEDNAPLV